MSERARDENTLGAYLKDRRARLDPVALGYPQARRRTPGLRREEVAQRAEISATWYTWLEQGRGGTPSARALERIAQALMLTDVEREHLFLIGLGRPPVVRRRTDEAVSPRLQHVLDALNPAAALIRTASWDVVAWNRASIVLLTDYGSLQPEERNIVYQFFCNPRTREVHENWDGAARFVVGAFRADVVRAGLADQIKSMTDELCRRSPHFAALWRDNEVNGFGGGLKRMHHPELGQIEIEYSAFAVDGRPDLSMVVYNPKEPADIERVKARLHGEASA